MHINQINAWADFWRNKIGVNVIPANAIKKKTWISWKDDPRGNWQEVPIPKELHDEWKKNGDFKGGMAVICGKVLHREDKKHLYFTALDADNKMGIDCMTSDIEKLAGKTIVERHANLNKAHIYVYTTIPMRKKSSDYTNEKLAEKMKNNEVPAIELKGEGQHGIMYCTPSPHSDGSNYQIIGTNEPMIMDGIGDVVDEVCTKYGLGVGDDGKVPMKILMDNETKIHEGHNRHEAIMRYAESILRKYPTMEEQVFEDMVMVKNKRMCSPPLNNIEIANQIKCAVEYISKQIAEEKEFKKASGDIFGEKEFWSHVNNYIKIHNPKGCFIKCLECGIDIEADPFQQKHYGHKVIIK